VSDAQVLLNLLTDNRQLTVLQYDRVIRYLQDKREMQLQLELGDAKDLPPVKSTGMIMVVYKVDIHVVTRLSDCRRGFGFIGLLYNS
jgi:hypothetical protein